MCLLIKYYGQGQCCSNEDLGGIERQGRYDGMFCLNHVNIFLE